MCAESPNWKYRERRELVKTLEAMGYILVRHERKHDWCQNPKASQPILHHKEIAETLAKHIINML